MPLDRLARIQSLLSQDREDQDQEFLTMLSGAMIVLENLNGLNGQGKLTQEQVTEVLWDYTGYESDFSVYCDSGIWSIWFTDCSFVFGFHCVNVQVKGLRTGEFVFQSVAFQSDPDNGPDSLSFLSLYDEEQWLDGLRKRVDRLSSLAGLSDHEVTPDRVANTVGLEASEVDRWFDHGRMGVKFTVPLPNADDADDAPKTVTVIKERSEGVVEPFSIYNVILNWGSR